jgi:DNA-binding MarR family transcriptional regulator
VPGRWWSWRQRRVPGGTAGAARGLRQRTIRRRTVRSCTVPAVDERAFFDGRPEHIPLGKLVQWVGTALARHHRRAVAEHGLTPTALGVLGTLGHRDGLSHRELARHLNLTPATLTPVVDALEASGQLRRERDPADRRVVRLSITPAGRDRLLVAFTQVATDLRDRMPRPAAEHERVIREYLLAVLDAVGGKEEQ